MPRHALGVRPPLNRLSWRHSAKVTLYSTTGLILFLLPSRRLPRPSADFPLRIFSAVLRLSDSVGHFIALSLYPGIVVFGPSIVGRDLAAGPRGPLSLYIAVLPFLRSYFAGENIPVEVGGSSERGEVVIVRSLTMVRVNLFPCRRRGGGLATIFIIVLRLFSTRKLALMDQSDTRATCSV